VCNLILDFSQSQLYGVFLLIGEYKCLFGFAIVKKKVHNSIHTQSDNICIGDFMFLRISLIFSIAFLLFTSVSAHCKTVIIPDTVVARYDFKIRSSDSIQSAPTKSVDKGDIINVTDASENGWYKVDYEDEDGWIYSDWVKPSIDSEFFDRNFELSRNQIDKIIHNTVVARYDFKIRSSANIQSTPIDKVEKGDTMKVTEALDTGWYRVVYKGTCGWIFNSWVKTSIYSESSEKSSPKRSISDTAVARYDFKIRSSNTIKSSPIKDVKKGDILIITNTSDNGWYKVEYEDFYGWIYSDWVTSKKLIRENRAAAERAAAERAAAERAADKKVAKIRRIEKELRSIPVSDYKRNLDLYRKLVTLDPSSRRYINKVSFYENKMQGKKERIADRRDNSSFSLAGVCAGYHMYYAMWANRNGFTVDRDFCINVMRDLKRKYINDKNFEREKKLAVDGLKVSENRFNRRDIIKQTARACDTIGFPNPQNSYSQ